MDHSAVVPTEDAVQALIDHLVYPLLPLKPSPTDSPSISQQKSVAKQVHAVVLLYNYYHRKQCPELEFLDFESFCKVAVIGRPTLLMHMKFMQRCSEKSGGIDKEFSITEEMVMEACNICAQLDASKDSPCIEGWPVSKVAVLIVDKMMENCLLRFGSIVQGVWSVVEKDLNVPFPTVKIASKSKGTNTKRRGTNRYYGNESIADEATLRQLAFLAVKEETGIDQTDLTVLENHLTYSLNRGKTATLFYLMQCNKSLDDEIPQVPVKDVISSLQGPLVRKSGDTCTATSVVEYFHLLPYVGIMSDWFSRKSSTISSQPLLEDSTNVVKNCFLKADEESCIVEGNGSNDGSDLSGQNVGVPNNETNGRQSELINENDNDGSLKRDRELHTVEVNVTSDKSDWPGHAVDIPGTKTDKLKDGIVSEKEDVHHMSESFGAVRGPQTGPDDSSISRPGQLPLAQHTSKSVCNIQDIYVEKRKKPLIQNGSKATGSGCKDKAGMVGSSKKPFSTEVTSARATNKDDKCFSGSLVHNGVTTAGGHLKVPLEPNRQHLDKVQVLLASKGNNLLQTALLALQKKRDELCQQHRELEDLIAQCEKNIQTIVSGGEDDLVLKIESVIEACNAVCSKGASQTQQLPQHLKRKRLSEAILILRSPCQELDDICSLNNWILPRYCVSPTTGGYLANVTVQGMDFECSGCGDLRSSPREARESAAMDMMSKLRSMASQLQ